ncbi:MobC family plasmid mobilization relaxosome protein [Gluconobacter japonicus]|uniref:MobC family plasmid mobilization relaxosome protein n=1 Tax=Gluconobacter japonicus TaxID=376620 RepID=UPI000785272B|nr:MobC family plasmid mobilization relaxosome protein [Gluconobacter japonicus]KXV21721.1 hypothetical protein AD935_06525 [Gluconobacter japonicus]
MVRKTPAAHGRKRDLRVRLPDHEHGVAVAETARHEVSVSRYLRTLLSEHCMTGRPPDEIASALSRLSRQLSGIGNNLNQIAHALNAGRHEPVSQVLTDIQATDSEVRALLRTLRP